MPASTYVQYHFAIVISNKSIITSHIASGTGKIPNYYLAPCTFRGFTTCIDARGKGKWMEYKARPVSSLETAPSSDNLPTRLLVLSLSVSHWHYTHGTLSYKSYSWQTLYRTLLNLTRLSGLTAIEGFWYLHYRGKAHLITDHERVIAWVFRTSTQARGK